MTNDKKGVALIISLGILAILAVIVTYFAANMRLELKASQNFNHQIKAKYLAEAGIERAVAELKYKPGEGARFSAVDTALEEWSGGFTENNLFGGLGRYSVSVIDCASQLYINDTNPRRNVIFKSLNSALGSPLTNADCDNIISNAPYATKEEIKTVSGIGNAKYNAIKNYITVFAYQDEEVVDPQDITTPYALQARAPINVNTASKELLQAIFTGLKADNVCPRCNGDGKIREALNNCPDCGASGDLEITDTEADNLATFIVANRAYLSWPEFYNSLQAAQTSGIIGQRDADLVMANCNPNMGLAPGVRNFGWAQTAGYVGKYVDVTDANHGLTASTTELCFNSGGYYDIECTGIYTNKLGMRVAAVTMNVVVKIFDLVRQSSQNVFESGSKNNVITYPEPIGLAGVNAAAYDGQIMLKTKTTNDPTTATRMRISFNNTLETDTKSGAVGLYTGQVFSDGAVPVMLYATGTALSMNSVVNQSAPGGFLSDGVLLTARRGNRLSYASLNNFDRLTGTISVWLKPMFNNDDTMGYGDVDRERMLFKVKGGSPGRFDGWNWWQGINQVWFWHAWLGSACGYIINGANTPLKMVMAKPEVFDNWRAGQWHHVVFNYKPSINYVEGTYITDGTWADQGVHDITVDSNYIEAADAVFGNYWNQFFPEHYPYTATSVLEIGWDKENANQQINGIIDEIRIWGGSGGFLDQVAMVAAFNEGRYITTGGYFISSAITKPTNSEWGTISWTEYDPDSLDPLQSNVGTSPYLSIDLSTNGAVGGDGNSFTTPSGEIIPDSYDALDDLYYHLEFSSQTAPLLDTAIVDDVTITYLPQTQFLYKRQLN